jgi:hypothetical protein
MSDEPGEKIRTYRAADEVYLPAMDAATRRGEKLSVEIRRFLIDYAQPEWVSSTSDTTTTTPEGEPK